MSAGAIPAWPRRVVNAWNAITEPRAETALIAVARSGDTTSAERLLRQDAAGVDAQDARGRTALHYAAARGHAEVAACLLAYGASHTLLDDKGRTALGPDNVRLQDLHAIRQRYHRFRRSDVETGVRSGEATNWSRDLAARGIVKVSGLIPADRLARLRTDFEGFVRTLEAMMARGEGDKRHYFEEEHWWPQDRAFVSNNAFKYSSELVRFCCRPELLEAATLYLGKTPFIQRALAMRYLPARSTTNDMFGWHHDLEDQRFKVMILLTDVGPNDQHMSYVVGSHALFHPYKMFLRNSCDLSYCRRHLPKAEIYDALGKAGDIFLFDTNGAHRGIRRETGSVRDVFLVEYNASTSNVWGGDVDSIAFEGVPPSHNPFEKLAAAEKKWSRPTTQTKPSWVANLPNVESWR